MYYMNVSDAEGVTVTLGTNQEPAAGAESAALVVIFHGLRAASCPVHRCELDSTGFHFTYKSVSSKRDAGGDALDELMRTLAESGRALQVCIQEDRDRGKKQGA